MRQTAISISMMAALFLFACGEKEQGPPKDSIHSPEAMAAAATGSGQIELDSIPVRTTEGKAARYGVESGRILYAYNGSVTGVREVTFDQWGMRERRYDSSAMVSRPGPPRYGLLITTPDATTVIDLLQKKGWTAPNDADERYLADSTAKDISLGEMIFRSAGAQRLPDETFRGLQTRVLKMVDAAFTSTIWIWRGIVLKEHFVGKDGLDFTVEPTLTEFDVEVPETTFDPPKDVTIEKRQPQSPGAMPLPQGPQGPPPQGQGPPPMRMPMPPK